MMGDNRDNSADSRTEVGYVPAENLEGKASSASSPSMAARHIWEVWKWPFAIRYSRILTRLTDFGLRSNRSWAIVFPIRSF